ncbi:hypothetical protein [Phaeovulum veldkampii]|jgi:hypothetical protein|uniref:hypothetical protein n=1 Tax=Phaeovulum veldkampii TaxID=33049 RepID=UPI00105E10C3|nr:hypothetical protein [Phaeovulum veldkampii]
MPQSCITALVRALNRILTSVPHDHPAALPVALWICDRDDLFEAVPQAWDRSGVDPTIWRALSQVIARHAALSAPSSGFTVREQTTLVGVTELTAVEEEVLAFLVACAGCDDLAALVEMLSDGTGLDPVDVQALCIGASAAEVAAVLTGRLSGTCLIEDGRASPALLRAADTHRGGQHAV